MKDKEKGLHRVTFIALSVLNWFIFVYAAVLIHVDHLSNIGNDWYNNTLVEALLGSLLMVIPILFIAIFAQFFLYAEKKR